jgi:hypothetical protein
MCSLRKQRNSIQRGGPFIPQLAFIAKEIGGVDTKAGALDRKYEKFVIGMAENRSQTKVHNKKSVMGCKSPSGDV